MNQQNRTNTEQNTQHSPALSTALGDTESATEMAIYQPWLNWLIQHYQLEDTEDSSIFTTLSQVFYELSLGNSAYAVDEPFILRLKNACYDIRHHTTKQMIDAPRPFIYDGQYLALYRYWSWEQQFAERVVQLSQSTTKQNFDTQRLAELKALLPFHDSPLQLQAVEKAIQQRFTLITGGPGTGKTYTLAHIIAVLLALQPDLRIAMVAPTGKASQRMQEALQNAVAKLPPALQHPRLAQQQTMTLHRLLGLGYRQQAKYHQRHPLPYDVVVVDETSMLDLNLARQLFNAIPADCRLMLLGDSQQLASVDVGSILADLQDLPLLANQRQHLTKSNRFDPNSTIGKLATWLQQRFDAMDNHSNAVATFQTILPATRLEPSTIQTQLAQLEWIKPSASLTDYTSYYETLMQGFMPFVVELKKHRAVLQSFAPTNTLNYPNEQVIETLTQKFDDYRILTATQQGLLGVHRLNQYAEKWIQQHLAKDDKSRFYDWYLGKAVMMTYNDYQLGLSNGDIGLCLYRQHQAFYVYFPSLKRWFPASRLPSNIQTAFALTIHKSQGSEFTHTAVVLDDGAERLLSLELLYTGITRAKKQLSLLTTAHALHLSLTQRTQRVSRVADKVKYLLNNTMN